MTGPQLEAGLPCYNGVMRQSLMEHSPAHIWQVFDRRTQSAKHSLSWPTAVAGEQLAPMGAGAQGGKGLSYPA